MKTLFTKPVSRKPYIWLADETNMIICYDSYQFCDLAGNPTPEEYRLKLIQEHYSDDDDEEFQFAEPENQGIQEPLIADSITDPDYDDIDEVFGQYGFKNRDGEYVIEPQYAYAHNFTNGLAAVNLNRTWYTDEDGRRSYECHYGYIDEHGKTIIPFAYDYAEPFNKYGVAVFLCRKSLPSPSITAMKTGIMRFITERMIRMTPLSIAFVTASMTRRNEKSLYGRSTQSYISMNKMKI